MLGEPMQNFEALVEIGGWIQEQLLTTPIRGRESRWIGCSQGTNHPMWLSRHVGHVAWSCVHDERQVPLGGINAGHIVTRAIGPIPQKGDLRGRLAWWNPRRSIGGVIIESVRGAEAYLGVCASNFLRFWPNLR